LLEERASLQKELQFQREQLSVVRAHAGKGDNPDVDIPSLIRELAEQRAATENLQRVCNHVVAHRFI